MKSVIKQDKITKSEQTRSKIEYRFLNMIPSKQWDKISVKELCEKCKITRGTFYLYFNDIYDLMEQIETRLLEDISERLSAIAPCEARGSVPCLTVLHRLPSLHGSNSAGIIRPLSSPFWTPNSVTPIL